MMLDIYNNRIKEVIANAEMPRSYAGLKRLVRGMEVGETKLVDVDGRVDVDRAIIDLYEKGIEVRTTQLNMLRDGHAHLSKPVYLWIERMGEQ